MEELDALIEELLEASRLEAFGTVERGETIDLLGLVAEEAARVEAAVEGEAVDVRGDPRLLRRLVRNLLENARRHGGGLGVEARVERLDQGARLTVADRGAGVAETERERIFEPFYRPPGVPETGKSFGLGLALVRQIARAHGGRGRVASRAKVAATVFEVDPRPLTRPPPPASNPASSGRAALQWPRRRPCSSCPGWWP